MAKDETKDRGINENDRNLDLHKGTTRRTGNKNTSPEEVQGSEHDPFLRSPSQHRSPDGFPRLSGNDQKRWPRSDLASDFWSQGVANWRAFDHYSNKNQTISDSTALIKEHSNPPTDRDTAESAPTHPRDQLYCSRIYSYLEWDGTSAPSSGADHLARQVPESSVTVFDEIPVHKNEPLCPSLGTPIEIIAPDVGARDQSLDLEAQQLRSTVSPSVTKSPTKSRDGKEHDSLMGADAMSLHTGRAGSTITSHLQIEDEILGHGKTKPATGLFLPNQRRNPYTPPRPSQVLERTNSSSAKDTSHTFEPRSVTPFTPERNRRIRHPRSLSMESPASHPSPPSSSPTKPRMSYSNDHGRSVSIRTGHSNPTYVSVMPNTPLGHGSLRHSRQSSMGTPPVPVESGTFKYTGEASRLFIDPHYPVPHQHTPEGQGQCFDTPGLMPPQMPTQFCDSLGADLPLFSSPIHAFDNNTLHYNTQTYEQGEQNAEYSQSNHFDSYATSQAANAAPNATDLHQNGNMYTQDTNGYGPRYYSNHTASSHQVRLYLLRIGFVGLI